MSNQQPSGDKQPVTKKPYTRPELSRYGDIRTITQNVGNKGAKDGGAAPTIRSQI